MWILQNTFSTASASLRQDTPPPLITSPPSSLASCSATTSSWSSSRHSSSKIIMLEVATAGRPSVRLAEAFASARRATPSRCSSPCYLAHIPDLFETAYSHALHRRRPHHPSGSAAGGRGCRRAATSSAPLGRLAGFGMLGLGDIVLPALAIAFARRMDLVRRPPAVATPFPSAAALTVRGLRCLCEGGCYVWASWLRPFFSSRSSPTRTGGRSTTSRAACAALPRPGRDWRHPAALGALWRDRAPRGRCTGHGRHRGEWQWGLAPTPRAPLPRLVLRQRRLE